MMASSGWRYHAQRIKTGEWLDRDLQIHDVSLTWALSGPGAMSFVVDDILGEAVALDGDLVLDEWSTAIYAEQDDQIKWGGIVKDSGPSGVSDRSITCTSFTGYPKGVIYMDEKRLWDADPFEIIRVIWAYVQSDPNANIGMQVSTNSSPVRVGDPQPGPQPVQKKGETKAAYEMRVQDWLANSGEPYELAWWNTPDCGDEIDNVLQQAEADYAERHQWADSGKNSVLHYVDLAYPTIGARRDDLRFVEGENIDIPVESTRTGDSFANTVIALGAGEERHMLRQTVSVPDKRLRRDKVVSSKDVLNEARLRSIAQNEYLAANDMVFFDSIQVSNHPNALFGSWSLGDEIRVQTHTGFQTLDRWMRITEWTTNPDSDGLATLSVTRV